MKIINENGKLWGIKKDMSYGVWHFTKIYLGEEENKEIKKTKKQRPKQ